MAPADMRPLTEQFVGRQYLWVEPARLRSSLPAIAAAGEQHGLRVQRVLGPPGDPVVLLSRFPVARLTDLIDPHGKGGLTSMARHWLSMAMALTALVLCMVAAALTEDFRDVTTGILLGATLTLLVVATAFPIVAALRDTTTRLTPLVQEFDGSPQRTVLAHHYRIHPSVVSAVAAELGYRYAGSMNGMKPDSRWNSSWITYVLAAPTPPPHPEARRT